MSPPFWFLGLAYRLGRPTLMFIEQAHRPRSPATNGRAIILMALRL
jgi:hypothetical protein